MNNSELLYQLMGQLFQEDPASLNDDSSQDTIEAWDSLGMMDLIALLEENFKVKFGLLEIEDLRTIGILKSSLEEKGISF